MVPHLGIGLAISRCRLDLDFDGLVLVCDFIWTLECTEWWIANVVMPLISFVALFSRLVLVYNFRSSSDMKEVLSWKKGVKTFF